MSLFFCFVFSSPLTTLDGCSADGVEKTNKVNADVFSQRASRRPARRFAEAPRSISVPRSPREGGVDRGRGCRASFAFSLSLRSLVSFQCFRFVFFSLTSPLPSLSSSSNNRTQTKARLPRPPARQGTLRASWTPSARPARPSASAARAKRRCDFRRGFFFPVLFVTLSVKSCDDALSFFFPAASSPRLSPGSSHAVEDDLDTTTEVERGVGLPSRGVKNFAFFDNRNPSLSTSFPFSFFLLPQRQQQQQQKKTNKQKKSFSCLRLAPPLTLRSPPTPRPLRSPPSRQLRSQRLRRRRWPLVPLPRRREPLPARPPAAPPRLLAHALPPLPPRQAPRQGRGRRRRARASTPWPR